MLTLKEQLLKDVELMDEEKTLKTFETFDDGSPNERFFNFIKEDLINFIENNFDDDLCGFGTQIHSWELVVEYKLSTTKL